MIWKQLKQVDVAEKVGVNKRMGGKTINFGLLWEKLSEFCLLTVLICSVDIVRRDSHISELSEYSLRI